MCVLQVRARPGVTAATVTVTPAAARACCRCYYFDHCRRPLFDAPSLEDRTGTRGQAEKAGGHDRQTGERKKTKRMGSLG